MLKLTRKVGETINIGDDIEVKVLGINGGIVRFGVAAPKGTPVNRNEIYQRTQVGLPKPQTA